jgi:hypothetical protein
MLILSIIGIALTVVFALLLILNMDKTIDDAIASIEEKAKAKTKKKSEASLNLGKTLAYWNNLKAKIERTPHSDLSYIVREKESAYENAWTSRYIEDLRLIIAQLCLMIISLAKRRFDSDSIRPLHPRELSKSYRAEIEPY